MEAKYILPYPISVNDTWKRSKKGIFLNKKVKDYRKEVWASLLKQNRKKFTGHTLQTHIFMYPPDHRKRDIDNILKVLLDALEHAGLYEDDGRITHLVVEKLYVIKDGLIVVKISDGLGDYLDN